MSALKREGDTWEPVWRLHALADLCNENFPEDPPNLGLEPWETDEFVLMLKTRIVATPELQASADAHVAASKQVKFFNIEAVRLTRGMLEKLRDRVTTLLEIPWTP